MSILKKLKKKYSSINQHQMDRINHEKERERLLKEWKELKDYLNIKI